MRRLLSTKYSTGAFNTAMLALRIIIGILMLLIGYEKLVHFQNHIADMPNLFGIGQKTTLILVLFTIF